MSTQKKPKEKIGPDGVKRIAFSCNLDSRLNHEFNVQLAVRDELKQDAVDTAVRMWLADIAANSNRSSRAKTAEGMIRMDVPVEHAPLIRSIIDALDRASRKAIP